MDMMRTTFKMENKNITMTRGDTLSFNVEITDQNGDIIEVDSADFTCKKVSTDESNIFHKALGTGILQDAECITVRVAPEDTRNVDAGRYFYDMQIGIGQDIFTILKGVLEIEQDVTF